MNTNSKLAKQNNIGFGSEQFDIGVYIANRPNMLEYQQINGIIPLTENEIYAIGQACGNGWRKVFNVYAKVIFALNKQSFGYLQHGLKQGNSWQAFRDAHLLQQHSKTALIFDAPRLDEPKSTNNKTIHIICGRTHAKDLINSGKLTSQLKWLNEEFAVDPSQRLIVCPYFDYRQLSNIKIDYLSKLIDSITTT